MKWNNGKERLLFEKEQARLRAEYLAAGMTEEQIRQLYDFDKDYLNLQQREARHTQSLNFSSNDEEENIETNNPLLKKFLQNFSTEDKHFETDRFGWIEQIEDKNFYLMVKSLTDRDKEIMTLLVVDGLNQTEISKQIGVSQQAISKRIKKFQIIFEKWL